jgi:hypothetical protein
MNSEQGCISKAHRLRLFSILKIVKFPLAAAGTDENA